MSLASGTRIGPYEVTASLGAGGMGEVYRARDTKLGRDVALKILPEAFASDPDLLMRFEREARTLALLNHPNIAHIHGLEESDRSTGSGQAALRALVMELVEGEDLSALIASGGATRGTGVGSRSGLGSREEPAARRAAAVFARRVRSAGLRLSGRGREP